MGISKCSTYLGKYKEAQLLNRTLVFNQWDLLIDGQRKKESYLGKTSFLIISIKFITNILSLNPQTIYLKLKVLFAADSTCQGLSLTHYFIEP